VIWQTTLYGSYKDLWFSDAKDIAEIPMVSPPMAAPNTHRLEKSVTFDK